MASAAAPHSTASICRIVGVRFTLVRQNSPPSGAVSDGGRTAADMAAAKGRLSINSRQPPDERHHQIERTLLSRGDFRPRQRSAGETNGRPLPDRPAIAADGGGVLLRALTVAA